MSRTIQVISPIDSTIYAERTYASQDKITHTIKQARQSQTSWKNTELSERTKICHAAIDAFIAKKDSLCTELCWQMGRPIQHAAGEIAGVEERARHMIEEAIPSLSPKVLPEKSGFTRYISHEPLGIVLVIAPWNYPYLTAINTIIPAIMAGNSVVLKHATQTPLCAERLFDAFQQAGLPEGVFQYLHLTHEDTAGLIQSNTVEHVAFTGSVKGGEMMEKHAAGTFMSVGLELGGKDPAYVRQDADIDQAVETIIDGAFFNSGQSCCGIERIYVHEEHYEAFVKKAVTLIKQYRLGRSDHPETTLGPLVSTKAADFIRDQINEAVQKGAITHIDPTDYPLDHRGSPYLSPQLLTQVNHSMRVMTEESFGPVVGVQCVKSDAEAIALMNDSDFGLTASVFTNDIPTGITIGNQLETGTFFINRCDYLDPALAWTGVKQSGHGCTLSSLGYQALTRPKSYHIKHVQPPREATR